MSSEPTPATPLGEDARAAHVARSGRLFEQLKETAKTILGALALALLFRSFILEPFNIPSASMLPRLLVGDYLFVSKWSYGYSRYSLPLGLPLWEGRVFQSVPERGDVAVFKGPGDNRTDFIKRVIGLPGDQIQMQGGVLYIGGVAVPKTRVADAVVPITRREDCRPGFEITRREPIDGGGLACRYEQYREVLPNGRAYNVIDQTRYGQADDTGVYLVPEGHYFMMGDNRDDSADSRFPPSQSGVGFVPAVNLVGHARMLFFSIDGTARWYLPWTWPGAIRFERVGTIL